MNIFDIVDGVVINNEFNGVSIVGIDLVCYNLIVFLVILWWVSL